MLKDSLPLKRSRQKYPIHQHVRLSDEHRAHLMRLSERLGEKYADVLRDGLEEFCALPFDPGYLRRSKSKRVPDDRILLLTNEQQGKFQGFADRYTDGNISDLVRAMMQWLLEKNP